MIEVKVRFFGAFRRYERGSATFAVRLEKPVTVESFKGLLAGRLHELFSDFGENGDRLIADSAIASETQVLAPEAVLAAPCTVSILPPVCGG